MHAPGLQCQALRLRYTTGETVPTNVHSFIVRVWQEVLDDESSRLAWRGSIDEVKSGKRLRFQELDAIPRFIQECIEAGAGQPKAGRKRPLVQFKP